MRVILPSPEDSVLLDQLPALVRVHNANGTEATGVPEILEPLEPEIVAGWITRLRHRDPDQIMVFAVEGERLTGAFVAQRRGRGIEMCTLNSPNLWALRRLRAATLAWARATDARYIVGTTFRHPRAFQRALGTRHLRDLMLLEIG